MDMMRTLGANLQEDGHCVFRVWAPFAEQVAIEIIPANGQATYQLTMHAEADGYYAITIPQISIGDRYYYCFANNKYPDPAANYQPEGVFGPSAVIQRSCAPTWQGQALADYIIYEIHVGTYTQAGTFDALIAHLDSLQKLGITAIELMPVAQFSGERNWGYDGVLPFAVQNSYGGPEALKRFVQACHKRNLSVILDVVYNHLGPEGNHLAQFGYYFSSQYASPWGNAINMDGPHSQPVRQFFIENARHWFLEYGVDALRLDAVHAIIDSSAYPFLEELAVEIKQLSQLLQRPLYLMVEDDARDLRQIRLPQQGGFGMDAMWNNDFHYALLACLSSNQQGFYNDFGRLEQVVKSYQHGFVFTGNYSNYHHKNLGRVADQNLWGKLVIYLQNHDQVGNHPRGQRISQLMTAEQHKLAASLLLLAPYIPLIFMGEEFGTAAPFQYFISHQNEALIEAVRIGRQREVGMTSTDCLDPQQVNTFNDCKLNHQIKRQNQQRQMLSYYRKLLIIRKKYIDLREFIHKKQLAITCEENQLLQICFRGPQQQLLMLANFKNDVNAYSLPVGAAEWRLILQSFKNKNPQQAQLPPYGFVLFYRELAHGE